jgi:hypothetical protein
LRDPHCKAGARAATRFLALARAGHALDLAIFVVIGIAEGKRTAQRQLRLPKASRAVPDNLSRPIKTRPD